MADNRLCGKHNLQFQTCYYSYTYAKRHEDHSQHLHALFRVHLGYFWWDFTKIDLGVCTLYSKISLFSTAAP